VNALARAKQLIGAVEYEMSDEDEETTITTHSNDGTLPTLLSEESFSSQIGVPTNEDPFGDILEQPMDEVSETEVVRTCM
jgi:hypothetical protein